MARIILPNKAPIIGSDPDPEPQQLGSNVPGIGNTVPGVSPKEATKRLVFNGSSYSGADIKVLVHRYNTGPEDIRALLTDAIDTYYKVDGQLLTLSSNLLPMLRDTVIAFKAGLVSSEQLERARQDYLLEVSSIRSNENVVANTPYYQNIAQALTVDTSQAISNPDGLSASINALRNTLVSVIEDWQSLRAAVNTRSKDFYMTKVLAELQTISISTDRDKRPVRALGGVQVKGFTRGPRTIAGTMIFTVFDRNVLWELLDADPSDLDADDKFRAALMDQLPPIDITIQFANEYGSLSRMTIYGVEFVNEGRTLSIENMLLEDVVQYVARDIDVMTPVLDKDGNQMATTLLAYNQASAATRTPYRNNQLRASDLQGETFKEGSNNRFKRRANPFF